MTAEDKTDCAHEKVEKVRWDKDSQSGAPGRQEGLCPSCESQVERLIDDTDYLAYLGWDQTSKEREQRPFCPAGDGIWDGEHFATDWRIPPCCVCNKATGKKPPCCVDCVASVALKSAMQPIDTGPFCSKECFNKHEINDCVAGQDLTIWPVGGPLERWQCACGWLGRRHALKEGPGGRVCPCCGASGGLCLEAHDGPLAQYAIVIPRNASAIMCRKYEKCSTVAWIANKDKITDELVRLGWREERERWECPKHKK